MKTSFLTVCVVLTVFLAGTPAWAGHLKFSPADEPVVQTNFNIGPAPKSDAYPVGRNGAKSPTETLAAVVPVRSDYVCFGDACGCGGGKVKESAPKSKP